MNKAFRNMSFYLLMIIIALSLINYLASEPIKEEKIDYSTFLERLEAGEVEKVTIVDGAISGVYQNGEKFSTFNPNDGKLIERLEQANVVYTGEPPPTPPWWTALFSTLLPIILLIGVWVFIMQQTQGGGGRVMSFGKSKARLYSGEDKTKVTFKDVAGAEEAKEELQEIVHFLKRPQKFIDLGARIPKGVLLVGLPGTGKTLLARAVAGEAGVPFFTISGSDFVEMFVGVGASRVRDLFDQAKKSSPCLVFIDEIDAVGRQRGAGLGGGHDEREQTLNQLLVEMDGFGVNEGVIILAATNRPDVLDPALLRPGRFDRQVILDRPDVLGREEILKVHLRGKPIEENIDISVLARQTPGFTGADLANMVNEAALLGARRNKRRISMEEMEEAIERIIAGPERKSRVISDQEKRLVAYHEAGHAIVGFFLPHTDPVHKVSVIPRGRAGGYTLSLPKEDRYFMTRSELLDRITQLLGGRAAEDIVLNEVSTGAQNDLERATGLARRMIMEYGMSERLGPLTFGHKQEQVFLGRDISRDRNYSEEVASAIDQEVRRLIDESYAEAVEILEKHRSKLDLLAQTLLEKETLGAEELRELLQDAEEEKDGESTKEPLNEPSLDDQGEGRVRHKDGLRFPKAQEGLG